MQPCTRTTGRFSKYSDSLCPRAISVPLTPVQTPRQIYPQETLGDIIAILQKFLMPPTQAAVQGKKFELI
jgi:hypothetical protein